MKTDILRYRIPEPHGRFNPEDAKAIGVLGGETIQLELNGSAYPIQVRVDEGVPQGVVLVPRKLGIPVQQPTPIRIHVGEMATED